MNDLPNDFEGWTTCSAHGSNGMHTPRHNQTFIRQQMTKLKQKRIGQFNLIKP